jgi:hypothetical protein
VLAERLLTEKSKGGVKSHTVINADEKFQSLVWFSPVEQTIINFTKLKCDEHTVYIFDKDTMITSLLAFYRAKAGFITRIKRMQVMK